MFNDEVPVRRHVNGNDRLDVQNILITIKGANAKVRVVLKRYANEIGDGILRGFL